MPSTCAVVITGSVALELQPNSPPPAILLACGLLGFGSRAATACKSPPIMRRPSNGYPTADAALAPQKIYAWQSPHAPIIPIKFESDDNEDNGPRVPKRPKWTPSLKAFLGYHAPELAVGQHDVSIACLPDYACGFTPAMSEISRRYLLPPRCDARKSPAAWRPFPSPYDQPLRPFPAAVPDQYAAPSLRLPGLLTSRTRDNPRPTPRPRYRICSERVPRRHYGTCRDGHAECGSGERSK